jgi:hypothetical protein
MTRSASDWDRVELASVMKGYIADQKAVLMFEQQADGKATLAQFNATGPLANIHKNLLKDGIDNHTIVPTKDGATVYVVDMDGSSLDAVDKGAQRYGKDNPVYYQCRSRKAHRASSPVRRHIAARRLPSFRRRSLFARLPPRRRPPQRRDHRRRCSANPRTARRCQGRSCCSSWPRGPTTNHCCGSIRRAGQSV